MISGRWLLLALLVVIVKANREEYTDFYDTDDEYKEENDETCLGFSCNSGKCLPLAAKCNTTRECDEGEDEIGCACSSDEYRCNDGECIESHKHCNNWSDCRDGSDEAYCGDIVKPWSGAYTCSLRHHFRCRSGGCIPMRLRCDGHLDCLDKSDERKCPCRADQWQCDSGECIARRKRCDGVPDCRKDHSDEIHCYPAATPAASLFKCEDGTKISASLKCNRVYDCPDYSDERNCPCGTNDFKCNNSYCIPASRRCDGTNDCQDRSDELSCPERGCMRSEFACTSGECVGKTSRCDGVRDCSDGSDELDCPCGRDDFHCSNGICVDITRRCNGYPDCSNGEDERNCGMACAHGDWKCSDGTCVKDSRRCDGHRDCPDFSDESDCPSLQIECTTDQFRCNDGQCLPNGEQCDGRPNCSDGEDEADCSESCYFRCISDEMCIKNTEYCDGVENCEDRSDEEYCDCKPGYFRCKDRDCIPNELKCNGEQDCENGSDEYNCDNYTLPATVRPLGCFSDQFECRVEGGCIQKEFVCDNNVDCVDRSDEENCQLETRPPHFTPAECLDWQFTCGDGNCIPHVRRCDNVYDCKDFSDEQKCFTLDSCDDNQWHCTSGECISASYRCDGIKDCADGSDEASPMCPEVTTYRPYLTPTAAPTVPLPSSSERPRTPPGSKPQKGFLNLRTFPSSQTVKASGDVVFQCRDEGPLRAEVRWSRLSGPLPPKSTDVRGRLEMFNITMDAAGIYICQAVGYSRNMPGVEVQVELNVENYTPPKTSVGYACDLNQATCTDGACIPKSSICDGHRDCSDGIDEEACDLNSHCEPNEFQCANKRCIMRNWLCDSEDDCQDGSDELECRQALPGELCRPYEFGCADNKQCIPKSFQCNGLFECVDRSDELGCRKVEVIEVPPRARNLQQHDTMTITCRAIGVPTPVVVWRRNWGHIPAKCTSTNVKGFSTLTCPNLEVEDSGAYSCEALNNKGSELAVPDTILTVKPNKNGSICDRGFFNREAKQSEDCISCFCFGVTSECKSADLFIFQIPTPIGQIATRLVGVAEVPGQLFEITEEPISNNFEIVPNYNTITVNRIGPWTRDSLHPYIILPQEYSGNHLTSYGGYLMYRKINPRRSSNRRASSQLPDVILEGNGIQLIGYTHPSYLTKNQGKVEIRFFPQDWSIITTAGPRKATREDLMIVLSNVSAIMIRAEEDGNGLTIVDFTLDSADATPTEVGALFVEQCFCPEGYAGLSCQKCASGYAKEGNNGVNDPCVPQAAVCEAGTYGNPQNGVPCKPCPCPHTSPTNQFARTCHLDTNGNPTCDCPSGYSGQRCEACSTGYVGNPNVPGDYCKLYVPPPSRCDQRGTELESNNECTCKSLVTGEQCDRCDNRSFFLSNENEFGCVECFCSGLSSNCGSSTLRRKTLRINLKLSSPENNARVVLRPINTLDIEETNIITEFRNNEFFALGVDRVPSGNYYWELPESFTGNKLSAYGGFINYTIRHIATPGSQPAFNNAPDLELVTKTFGNLLYYDTRTPAYDGIKRGQVQLVEKYWQSIHGLPVPRHEFLTILADLDHVLVKATYTTSTSSVSLISASMDIAEVDAQGERAWLVEECQCPVGYVGLSCEKCSPGYTRDGGGLYFGTCSSCSCNGHSEECHPETGDCYNCADNFAGKTCEECAPGYQFVDDSCILIPQNTSANTSCWCDAAGSRSGCRDDECVCKANVAGDRCNRCKPGTFNLQSKNLDGCKQCYCSGVTYNCQQSYNLRRKQIPNVILPTGHEFVLISWQDRSIIETGFKVNSELNQISYTFDDLSERANYYWSLPNAFTGNKITSYGGDLIITQKFESPYYSVSSDGLDVILVGDQKTIFWSGISKQPADQTFTYTVKLHEEFWNIMPGTSDLRPIAHYDFMGVLSNLRQVLVRATLSSATQKTYISDITMDTAIVSQNGSPALDVEVCTCPPGYIGTSCERCASLHYRDEQNQCAACPCQDNSKGCSLDRNGVVVCDCIPPYNGANCKNIEGDDHHVEASTLPPLRDPQISVMISNKVLDIQVGNSAHWYCQGRGYESRAPVEISWYRDGGDMPYGRAVQDESTGELTINDVEESDSGTYICQVFDGVGYAEERAVLTVSGNPPTRPVVRIEPSYIEVYEGQPVELTCQASGNPAPKLTWIRNDRRRIALDNFQEGVFRIEAARAEDAGQYSCLAQNTQGSDHAVSEINIKLRDSGVPLPIPRLITIPINELILNQGESSQIRCTAEHTTVDSRQIRWERLNGELPRTFAQYGDILNIVDAQPEDTGTYRCFVENQAITPGTILITVQAIYDESTPYPDDPPKVRIDQTEVDLPEGESITINCTASGYPIPTIRWIKDSGRLGEGAVQRGDSLVITNAKMSDAALYICEGLTYDNIPIFQAPSYVTISRRMKPVIEMWPSDQIYLRIGGEAALQCRETGIPQPEVKWARGDGLAFTPRTVMEPGNVIRILNATIHDDAEYICTASNVAGTAKNSTRVVIVADPVITIRPKSYIEARVGEEVNVECRVDGYPKPTVTWSRGSNYLGNEEPYGARLYIPSVQISDADTYTCTANNLVRTVEEKIKIDVLDERNGVKDTFYVCSLGGNNELEEPGESYTGVKQTYHAVEGGPAFMECKVTSPRNVRNQSPFRINWLRSDRRPLSSTARIDNNVLRIERVSVRDAGEYQCQVLVGQIPQAIIKYTLAVDRLPIVTLRPANQTVLPGDTVYLRCYATGDEPIDLKWRPESGQFSRRIQEPRPDTLVFNRIQEQDAGGYICEATNAVGTATATATVMVRETITEHHLTSGSRTQRAESGETVSLACDGEGQAARIHWYKEGGALPIDANQSTAGVLTLVKVQPSDSGRYVCRLDHESGTSSQNYVDLIVTGDNPILNHNVLIQKPASPLITGESVRVDCKATSPDIKVTWYGPENSFPNQQAYIGGSTLLLDNVSPSQAGDYQCIGWDSDSKTYTDEFSLAVNKASAASPIRNASDKVLEVRLGDHIAMPCMTDLDGDLQYEWRRQDAYLPLTINSTQRELEIPKVSENDAGVYICRVSNNRINMATRVVLKVSHVVPQFGGDSYIALPPPRDFYQEFNIEVDFKPLYGSGMILYTSQKAGRDPGDIISLAVVDGFPEFKFDTGNGPVTIRGDRFLELDQWHSIKINRKDKDGYMYVDGYGPYSGSSIGNFYGLDLMKQPLYVGGMPDYNELPADFAIRTGYIGCISRLLLGNEEISLMSQDYPDQQHIENCDSCKINPCSNNGVCQDFLNERGYICICPSGYSGTNCARLGQGCTPGVCGQGRCQDSDQGIKCVCTMGYVGDRCEERKDIEYPGFSGGAYLAYTSPIKSRQLTVGLQVKPTAPLQDGIIMYASESRYGHGGFVAIIVKDRHIEFRIEIEKEFNILRSRSALRENTWTNILITREFDVCKLWIDNQLEDEKRFTQKRTLLHLKTPMYIGGFDGDTVTINNKTDVFVGFNGCVKEVKVQGYIVKSSISSANVQECNSVSKEPHRGDIPVITTETDSDYTSGDCSRCLHGHCRPQSTMCTCDNGYQGRFCNVSLRDLYQRGKDRCATKPCGNGGYCQATYEGSFICNCYLGYSGFTCHNSLTINQDFQLNGKAYVELPASLIRQERNDPQLIALAFTSIRDNGVLLYLGGERLGDQRDFMLLTIEDGFVKLDWNLGGGNGNFTHSIYVGDGKRHKLVLMPRGREMQLTLDNEKKSGYSMGYQTKLDATSSLYVGGVPDEVHNGSLRGLTGCVEQIEFGSGPIDIGKTAISAKNIVPCNNSRANEIERN